MNHNEMKQIMEQTVCGCNREKLPMHALCPFCMGYIARYLSNKRVLKFMLADYNVRNLQILKDVPDFLEYRIWDELVEEYSECAYCLEMEGERPERLSYEILKAESLQNAQCPLFGGHIL